MFRMLRASFWATAALVVATGCGPRPLEPRDPTPGVPHFTVKTFNVETGKQNDGPTVAAIGASNADIVCLQEITPEWQAVLEKRYADQYAYRLYRPLPASAGLAVLSHYPILDAGGLWAPNHWHPAWHVIVNTPAGWLQILNVHLRAVTSGDGNTVNSVLTTAGDHRYEIKAFTADLTKSIPTMIMGDFNEGGAGAALDYLKSEGYQDVLPLYHPGQPTWRHAGIAGQFETTLDHILFDGSVEPLNSWVINAGNSDHLPVMAHFEAAYDWQSSGP